MLRCFAGQSAIPGFRCSPPGFAASDVPRDPWSPARFTKYCAGCVGRERPGLADLRRESGLQRLPHHPRQQPPARRPSASSAPVVRSRSAPSTRRANQVPSQMTGLCVPLQRTRWVERLSGGGGEGGIRGLWRPQLPRGMGRWCVRRGAGVGGGFRGSRTSSRPCRPRVGRRRGRAGRVRCCGLRGGRACRPGRVSGSGPRSRGGRRR